MAINDSTLSTDVWTTMKTVILAAAPYITNSSTAATTVAGIETAYNDKAVTKPQIIINPIEKGEGEYKFGSRYGKRDINVTVDCYYKNTLGTDQLSDQVEEAKKLALEAGTILGIDLYAISTDQAFVDPNQSKFQMKSVTFSFRRE